VGGCVEQKSHANVQIGGGRTTTPPRAASPEPNQPEPRGVASGRLAAPERTTSPPARTAPIPNRTRTRSSPNHPARARTRSGSGQPEPAGGRRRGGTRCMETCPASVGQHRSKEAPPHPRSSQTTGRNVAALLLLPRGRVLFSFLFLLLAAVE